jgi:adenine C2-methylase RlmN of 23S rRNA A2503 and tRNA A37
MLAGMNDTDGDLKRLPDLLNGIPVKLNLIPYN